MPLHRSLSKTIHYVIEIIGIIGARQRLLHLGPHLGVYRIHPCTKVTVNAPASDTLTSYVFLLGESSSTELLAVPAFK
jgi:hypothetical protein